MDFLEFDETTIEPVDVGADFSCLELDDGRKPIVSEEHIKICPSCGFVNPRNNDFCKMCQVELADFRLMEVDTVQVKVKAVFPSTDNYTVCPVCGAFNEKTEKYCRDCTSALNLDGKQE